MSTAEANQEKTGLGNYFVANYPPFSVWKPDDLGAARQALASPPKPDTPLGLYLHIPFCRKRCKFCYFRVYTDKNARDVETYIDALVKEIELYSRLPAVGGRPLHYVYFGGGTPSYLSAAQLTGLVERLNRFISWKEAAEVTFECEPGTLQQHKLAALRDLGVTRLSLGIENFSDQILEANGRAHLSAEIYRSYQWARDLHFDQINIDLIAGMVGETWDNWRACIRKTIELSPDSVTIYQMELPHNTVFSKDILGSHVETPVADWPTKRAWLNYAYDELLAAGYHVSSAYTVVKDPHKVNFSSRDNLWQGSDLLATGVASFGHVSGVHYQNKTEWGDYIGDLLERNRLPLYRAMRPTPHQLLVREMILQLKKGYLDAGYFRKKFGVNILDEWRDEWLGHQGDGMLAIHDDRIELTRQGLLHADALLPAFFEPEHRGVRYT